MEPPGLHEARTRVTLFLPAARASEKKAILALLRYLERQRTRRIAVTGHTRSNIADPVFFGSWWSKEKGKWYREPVVHLIVDYATHLENQRLAQALGRLRRTIEREYVDRESEQDVIWIMAQRVTRLV